MSPLTTPLTTPDQVKEVNLISPSGIKLSSFIKLAESLNTTLRTHEVAQIYLKPPTSEWR